MSRRRQTTDSRVRIGVSAVGVSVRSYFTHTHPHHDGSLALRQQPLNTADVGLLLDSTTPIGDGFESCDELKVDLGMDKVRGARVRQCDCLLCKGGTK